MTSAVELAPASPPGPPAPAPGTPIARAPRERTSAWPLVDRVGYALCWAVGIGLCLIALAILWRMRIEPAPRDATGTLGLAHS